MKTSAAVVVCCLLAGSALAQPPAAAPASPVVASIGGQLGMIKGYLTKAAEQVPENLYTFKATPEVRSLGQLFAHVADSNYSICAAAAGEADPALNLEKTKTAKADIAKALGESFAYCEKALAGTTDANAGTIQTLFGMKMARLAWLSFAIAHDFEHYGNVVTYMRLNKMVPPSSQGRGM